MVCHSAPGPFLLTLTTVNVDMYITYSSDKLTIVPVSLCNSIKWKLGCNKVQENTAPMRGSLDLRQVLTETYCCILLCLPIVMKRFKYLTY